MTEALSDILIFAKIYHKVQRTVAYSEPFQVSTRVLNTALQ